MIEIKELYKYCTMKKFNLPYNKEGRYYFKDNNSPILGVAHLDYVGSGTTSICKGTIISSALDDRVGVYLLLNLLPKLGLKFDVLLTEDEESCNSTAKNFIPNKEYNWIFSFDRRGDDCVVYNYRNEEFLKNLSKHFKIGIGSYSDICELEHLGCSGVNVGAGYLNQHTEMCFLNIKMLENNIKNFIKFFNSNKNNKFKEEKWLQLI